MKVAALFLSLAAVLPVHVKAQLLNPAVTQATIHRTICVPGWTKTVRPSTSYTNRIKRDLLRARGLHPDRIGEFELDHRVPIELGGHPREPENLWLQPWEGRNGARAKDVIETRLKRRVCAGQLDLLTAQVCMADDWRKCPR